MNKSPESASHHKSPLTAFKGGVSSTLTGTTVIVAATPGCPDGF
mgnify:CR=1 FL=1